MAIDWTTVLGGLGATVAAFGDPQQSLLMSQGIMRRNQQMRERKEREEQQRQELALRQQKLAMERAQMQQEAMRRQAASQMIAQQLDPNAGAQLASFAPAVYSPGQSAGVPTNPMQEAAMTRAAIVDPTGQTPFPFVPRPTLKPGVFSGTQGQQRGALPPHVAQHARTLVALGDDEGAAKVIADAKERQRKEAMPPDPTAKQRNWEYAQTLPPEQREAFLGQGGLEINVGGEAQPSPAEFSTWGKYEADKGKRFLYDQVTGEPVLENKVHPGTGQPYKEHVQVLKTTKEPGAEETRGLALSNAVLTQAGEISAVLDQLEGIDWVTYGASRMPLIGQFFSDTTGGQLNTKVNDMIQNSTYLVSGAEAPPREVQQRFDTYALKPWDSVETARMKLSYLTAIAENIQKYRLNTGITDDDKPVPESAWRGAFAEADAAVGERAGFTIPVSPDGIPASYSFNSYDADTGVYTYQDKDGNIKFWAP